MTSCFVQQITKIDASQGVDNYKRFEGKGRREETFDDQKMEANVINISQPICHGIPHHINTTTSRGSTTTRTNCRYSKPKTNGQT
jgi:hypothetical protein